MGKGGSGPYAFLAVYSDQSPSDSKLTYDAELWKKLKKWKVNIEMTVHLKGARIYCWDNKLEISGGEI